MNKAKDVFKGIGGNIAKLWSGMTKTARIVACAVISAVAVTVVVLIIILNQTNYVRLYKNKLTPTEYSAAVSSLNTAGITDVKLEPENGIIKVNKNDIDRAMMETSSAGVDVPFNSDIYNDGVGLFTTDKDREEYRRQMQQSYLISALRGLAPVDNAKVILNFQSDNPVVINSKGQTPSSVSAVITLKEEARLTSKQIEGIYSVIRNAVPGLTDNKISLIDSNSLPLIPGEGPTEGEMLTLSTEKMLRQKQFATSISEELEEKLNQLFKNAFGQINVGVTATLDFGNEIIEEEIHTPTADNNGDGIIDSRDNLIDNETNSFASANNTGDGGLVGTGVNADISPDYPELVEAAKGEAYVDYKREINYVYNTLKRHYESDEYKVVDISAGVLIDNKALSDAQVNSLRKLVANAIGAKDESKVEIVVQQFSNLNYDSSKTIGTGALSNTSQKNMLIFLIVALGILLVFLLIIAILASGTKRRRNIRARISQGNGGESALDAVTALNEFFGSSQTHIDTPGSEGYAIQHISDGSDSKEGLLRGEIRDFSKQNPEIVAQMIRVLMRDAG